MPQLRPLCSCGEQDQAKGRRDEGSVYACCFDLLKSLPSLLWLIMCLYAIPGYSRVGWVAPVVCAIFSSIMSVLATRDTILYLSPSLAHYSLVEPFLNERANRAGITVGRANLKFGVASAFTLCSVVFTITFLAIAYGIIKPEQDDMPCDGECEDCAEDPDCRAWVRDVEKEHPEVDICPAAKRSYEGDVTFSCLADGYWMMCTSIIGALWMGSCWFIIRLARQNTNGRLDDDGRGKGDENQQQQQQQPWQQHAQQHGGLGESPFPLMAEEGNPESSL